MKTNKLFAILAAGLLLTSCNDWLQENPKAFNTGEIRTETQAESRVNRLYRNGAPTQISSTGAYRGGNYSCTSFLTGYYSSSYWGQETDVYEDAMLTRQNNTPDVCVRMTNDVWTSCFREINVANDAIAQISKLPASTKTKALIAEAKFFRAFNYFHLVKHFGGVPVNTEPTSSLEDGDKPRNSAEEVYALVEQDLKDAINDLPAGTMQNNGNRVGKTVAQALLADVYMQKGDKNNAKTYLAAVVNSGDYALVEGDDMAENSYINKLRTQDGTSEAIYFVEYDRDLSTMNRRTGNVFDDSMEAHAAALGIYRLVIAPTEAYCAVYDPETDLRIQNQQFFVTEATVKVKADGTTWTWKWDGKTRGDWYYLEESCLYDGKGTKDWNIYRYAEILLDYAECLGKAEGAKYLAQVMHRADLTGKSVEDIEAELKALSDQQFTEACWTERVKEFPLEYKIWDLCLRTKKFPVINANHTVTYVDLVGAKNGYGATFTEYDLLWPVPVQEIQRNPNLEQNPGYARQ